MKKHYVVLVLVVIGLIAISGCVDKSEVKSVTEDEHQIDKPSVESETKDEQRTSTAEVEPATKAELAVASKDRCDLEPDVGPCRAAIPKYYFDKETQTCKEFIWGGCEGTVPFHTLAACEETCGLVQKWVKCTVEEKKAEICTADYTPVCGDNGKTYSNKCSACSSGEIDAWTAGECPPPVWTTCTEEQKKAEICTLDYTPVCGDNGKTYSNKCVACSSGEITAWTAGECPPPVWTTCTEEQKQNQVCTMEYVPVCGDNGKTYGNKCSACSSGEINAWTVGECANVWTPCTAEQIENKACTMEYVPVCGNNGKTYGNKCEACSSGEISAWTFGECPQKWTPCTEEQKQNQACTMEYVPVCGDNGKTYANKCEACSSGEVNSWTEGECPPPVWLNCTEEEKKAEICTLDYTPVCGDNGKTYGNKCMACSSGEITAWTAGECADVWTPCTTEQKQNQACTREYVPVCGDNGKTYGNKCSACSSGEITAWTFGECT